MKTFETLKTTFIINWTTVLVGWEGVGMIFHRSYDWEKFPPLLTWDEIYRYCYDIIAKRNDKEELNLIVTLLEFENKSPDRALVRSLLQPLARLYPNDVTLELRKWRAITLGETLEQLSNDPLYDWISIAEFWMLFGFPPDSPIEFQCYTKNVQSNESYTIDNIKHLVDAHRTWLKKEIDELKHTYLK